MTSAKFLAAPQTLAMPEQPQNNASLVKKNLTFSSAAFPLEAWDPPSTVPALPLRCCPAPPARLVRELLLPPQGWPCCASPGAALPWRMDSLPARISSNGSCCLTCWDGPQCSSLTPAARGRDTRQKDRRVNNSCPPCNAHFSYPVFWCLFFYFFLSSWAFFTSGVPHTAILPSCSTGLHVPPEAAMFSRLSPFTVVQGQDWEQGGSCWGTRAGSYAETPEQPRPAHKRESCHENLPCLALRNTQAPRCQEDSAEGYRGSAPSSHLLLHSKMAAGIQGSEGGPWGRGGGTRQQAELSAATVLLSLNGKTRFV